MNLHENSDLFIELVSATAKQIGLPEIYVEKDYWVSNALRLLSESSFVNQVVFKGGTSLSKAYRLIDRFSEDIDLAIIKSDGSDSIRKKLIKNVEKTVSKGLNYLPNDPRESKGSRFRKTIYEYPKRINESNFGEGSSELLVEINSFTVPDPYNVLPIQSLIAEVLQKHEKSQLLTQYKLESFFVNVLSVERTLVEKMLRCIKDSYKVDSIGAMSKNIRHLYDICLILKRSEYREFVAGEDFTPLCTRCIHSEKESRLDDSEQLEKPLCEAPLFTAFDDLRPSLDNTYKNIFSDFVYGPMPTMSEIEESLSFIKEWL